MLTMKPNAWGINDLTMKNELRYMLLDFQENAEGKFVSGFKKHCNFIDGYCQLSSNAGLSINIIGIQDKLTHEWFFTPEAKEFFNVQIEQFDDAILVYTDKKPKKKCWEFWYRVDTKQELC